MLVIPVVMLGGLILGWFASVVLKPRYYHGVVLNLVVGVGSAFICGYYFAPVFNSPSILSGSFSFKTVMIALVGSTLILLIIDLVRRAGTR